LSSVAAIASIPFLCTGLKLPRTERRTSVNRPTSLFRLVPAALALLALLPVRSGLAQGTIQPLAADGTAYGMTLTDWSVAFCQWLLSIPQSTNPDFRFDKAGVRPGVGQHAPVWFVPGFEPGSSGTRTMTVPDGQSVLVAPMLTVNSVGPPGSYTDDEVRAGLDTGFLDRIGVLEVSLDGVPIPDVKRYRLQTPIFTITLAPGNLFGVPVTAAKDGRAVAAGDGYWLLLPPLPVGTHPLVIHVEGVTTETSAPFKSEWTVNLRVQKPNEPLP
jgi:hypothetical protein